MLKQKSWKNTVVNLPCVFQDAGSLKSQIQNLWSAQTQTAVYLETVLLSQENVFILW